jgi:hypothetical protein
MSTPASVSYWITQLRAGDQGAAYRGTPASRRRPPAALPPSPKFSVRSRARPLLPRWAKCGRLLGLLKNAELQEVTIHKTEG